MAVIGAACLPLAAAASPARSQPAPDAQCDAPAPQSSKGWARRHKAKLQARDSSPWRVVLLGDSITQRLERNYPRIWEDDFESIGALNLGFGGDTTANLLWRMHHGEIAGLQPDVAVILIGTNNLACRSTSGEIAADVSAVVAEAHRQMPNAHILLVGILPRLDRFDRLVSEPVNALLADRFDDLSYVTFVDFGPRFREQASLYKDKVHPNERGSALLAQLIVDEIDAIFASDP